MNENLNLCEILKDCPKGAKFYSTIFGEETYFVGIDKYEGHPRPITICGEYGEGQSFELSRFGHPYADDYGECCLWPSKDVRTWEGWQCPKPKFDPTTLQPFDKVLVRKTPNLRWRATFFSNIEEEGDFSCGLCRFKYVVPYNEETKHLLGTEEEVPEFYQYWEE